MLGAAQAAWLVETLAASRARWKIVACDQPIALVIGDGDERQEGFANDDGGPPLGRELELAGVLAALKARGVHNVAWITADVHYAAAHHFDPARARGVDFDPFWEFVAGPIHAGTFGPERARSDARRRGPLPVGAAAGHGQPRAVGRAAELRHDRRHARRARGRAVGHRRPPALPRRAAVARVTAYLRGRGLR